MRELEFIAALRQLPLHAGARDLRDDAAVLEIGGETLIFTHDTMAEGVHFRADADPFDIAWKLVAVNLSDLAAKGAEPIGILLSHTLGARDERFIEGLRAILDEYGVPLMGGDTIAADGPRTLGLTSIGRATHRPVPSRTGASPGDSIFVTGILGRAMLGFEGNASHTEAFDRPRPLLSEGQALAPLVTAMMDVSDGLLLDCWRLAEASDVSIRLDRDLIPVADDDRFEECLRWGDDYQLLFTIAEGANAPPIGTRIGIVRGAGRTPLYLDDIPFSDIADLGYQHCARNGK